MEGASCSSVLQLCCTTIVGTAHGRTVRDFQYVTLQYRTRSRLKLDKAPWRLAETEYHADYRPFAEVKVLLSMAKIMTPAKIDIFQGHLQVRLSPSLSMHGLHRSGPFKKFDLELSAERGLVETVCTHAGSLHLVQPLKHGETLCLRVQGPEWGYHENLLNRSHTTEEDDFLYIAGGVLSGRTIVAKQSNGTALGKPTMRQVQVSAMCDAYERVRGKLENAWHEQRWRGSTNDSHKNFHKSTEFGWSTFPG